MSARIKWYRNYPVGALCSIIVMMSACDSGSSVDVDEADPATDPVTDPTTDPVTDPTTDPTTDPSTDPDGTPTSSVVLSCEEMAAVFQTKGSANSYLPEPEVSATCEGDSVVVISNQIPDYPYYATSQGNPEEYDREYTIPAIPTVGDTISDIPALGVLGVAINGIPIYGATEGMGGDVMTQVAGFDQCGGHNGPTGYHYHTFSVIGSEYCLFSEAEASAESVLFGFALDGYPIYSGNFQFKSSWYLSDASLFATDTFSAHTYVEGSGDLDQCNGRIDADGNYAYYTTDAFPYTLGCYRGVANTTNGGGGGDGPPGGGAAPIQ